MNEAGLVIGCLLIAVGLCIAFGLGRIDGRADLKKAVYDNYTLANKFKADLVTERAVRHNLNCLIGDLKFDISLLKPDAAAYNQSKGLWCTDQPELIRHHAKKEQFFRLGYPEHKL